MFNVSWRNVSSLPSRPAIVSSSCSSRSPQSAAVSTSLEDGPDWTRLSDSVRWDIPRWRVFLQFKGLSGGRPRWRAAYDEAGKRALSQSEINTQRICRISGHLVAVRNQRHFHHPRTPDATILLKACVPLAVLSIDCFPDPRRECTPGTHDGTSLSRIGPICLQIRSKWSGAICLLAATCRGKEENDRSTGYWHATKHFARAHFKRDGYKCTNLHCNAFCRTAQWRTKYVVTSQGSKPRHTLRSWENVSFSVN